MASTSINCRRHLWDSFCRLWAKEPAGKRTVLSSCIVPGRTSGSLNLFFKNAIHVQEKIAGWGTLIDWLGGGGQSCNWLMKSAVLYSQSSFHTNQQRNYMKTIFCCWNNLDMTCLSRRTLQVVIGSPALHHTEGQTRFQWIDWFLFWNIFSVVTFTSEEKEERMIDTIRGG